MKIIMGKLVNKNFMTNSRHYNQNINNGVHNIKKKFNQKNLKVNWMKVMIKIVNHLMQAM